MIISIGNDHAGPDYKKALIHHLEKFGHQIINHGTDQQESVDYPDFVHPVAIDVHNNKSEFGILICGSANGVAMTANKYQKVRAAVCWIEEIAVLARLHNNANIICIPARYTSEQQVIKMVTAFINTAFEGGRHQQRVDKIPINC